MTKINIEQSLYQLVSDQGYSELRGGAEDTSCVCGGGVMMSRV